MAIPVLDARNQLFGRDNEIRAISDQMTEGVPRRAMKHSIPITQELVSIDGTTSKWTARVIIHVIKSPNNSLSFVESLHRTGRSNLLHSSGMSAVGNQVVRAEGQPSFA